LRDTPSGWYLFDRLNQAKQDEQQSTLLSPLSPSSFSVHLSIYHLRVILPNLDDIDSPVILCRPLSSSSFYFRLSIYHLRLFMDDDDIGMPLFLRDTCPVERTVL
jgi:hypothetical protein